jgi:general secretion pathway protein N
MSLVQGRWLIPGGAAIAAIGLPFWLLQSASPEIDAPAPLVVTELAALPIGGLEQARTMPIFSPTRAPPAPPPSPEALAAAAAAPAPQPMPALVGLVSRARGKGIALVRSSNGQTVTISPGESVDGWQLVGIGRDRATFVSNGERRVASLDFRNRLPAEGAPASSAPSIPSPPATMPAGAPGRQVPPGWPEPWLANQSGPSR